MANLRNRSWMAIRNQQNHFSEWLQDENFSHFWPYSHGFRCLPECLEQNFEEEICGNISGISSSVDIFGLYFLLPDIPHFFQMGTLLCGHGSQGHQRPL